MTKETINLLDALLPEANPAVLYESAEEQTKDDLKNLANADPIGCIFGCNACPDIMCVCNMTN